MGNPDRNADHGDYAREQILRTISALVVTRNEDYRDLFTTHIDTCPAKESN